MAPVVKNLPANARDIRDAGSIPDPLEEEKATHSNILAWGNPRTEEPGWLRLTYGEGMGQRVVSSLFMKLQGVIFKLLPN